MKNVIITIGREYGSGGHYIGKMLAEQLNIPCYDKELLVEVAKGGEYSQEMVEKNDEKPNGFMYSLFGGTSSYGLPLNQRVFLAQFEKVRELAEKGPCVFVGRCADYVLSDRENVLNVFIYTDMETKRQRVIEYYGVPEKKALETIKKTNKKRAKDHNYYTNKK